MFVVSCRLASLAAVLALAGAAHAAEPEFSGQLRPQWLEQHANERGPLAATDALQPGIAPLPFSGAIAEAELRASAHVAGIGITSVATLQAQRFEGSATESRAWFNELYASGVTLSSVRRTSCSTKSFGRKP